jgi:hypothetical protein
MEPQPAKPQDTTFFQEYQSIDNSADLRGQLYRFRIHGLFLVAINMDVKPLLSRLKEPCQAGVFY